MATQLCLPNVRPCELICINWDLAIWIRKRRELTDQLREAESQVTSLENVKRKYQIRQFEAQGKITKVGHTVAKPTEPNYSLLSPDDLTSAITKMPLEDRMTVLDQLIKQAGFQLKS